MVNFGGPGLTDLNARGKRRQAELDRKAIVVESEHRRQLARRPRGPRLGLVRRIVRRVRGGGD